MKKVLLLSLGLVMGLGAFAQVSVHKSLAKPMKVAEMKATGNNFAVSSDFELKGTQSVVANRGEVYVEAEAMYSSYDLQSNAYVANRMYQLKDGSVAVVATMSNEEYDEEFPDRGTGYNFAREGKTGNFSDAPEARIEANATGTDIRTGWPSIAPYGAEGEILVNHGHENGLSYYLREKAGQGEWDGPHAIPNPADVDAVVDGEGVTLSWARIVTTGENNDVLHVFANAAGNKAASYYLRTEDLENWDIQFSPLEMDNKHINGFNADGYAVSANGDNIAVLYCDNRLWEDVMLYESNDAGKTWESRVVWETPIDTAVWLDESVEPQLPLMDEIYAPTQGSVAIGKDGVSHVALSVGMFRILTGGYYGQYYGGFTLDGVAYWNDTTTYPNYVDGELVFIESPIRPYQDDSLKHALRLWWPDTENEGYIKIDATNFCAITPPHPDGFDQFQGSSQYTGNTETATGDYLSSFGMIAYPSIAVDPAGNLAVAFSAPDVTRLWQSSFYYRSCYVNYKPVDSLYWGQMPLAAPTNLYADFIHTADECTFVSAVSTPVKENEFWFSCYTDDTPGFHTGAQGASQANISYGTVHVFKFNPEGTLNPDDEIGIEEATDVVYNIYPNPASDYIVIGSSMDADATVTFSNIAGQTVKVVNMNLTTGDNSIVVSDLTSGIYFCTVTANGYSHTSKVVVE